MGTDEIGRCFDGRACREGKAARHRGVRGISRLLLDAVERRGLRGASVLEIGCGVGALSIEAARRGAARVSGFDLSPRSIAEAIALARDAGVDDRCSFRAADAAHADLARHDVVVHNKVVCCYPDADALLRQSIPAAGRVYAFSAPPSDGVRGAVARAVIALENVFWRLVRSGYRAYVHDLGRIDARLRQDGFVRVESISTMIWQVAVYERRGSATAATE